MTLTAVDDATVVSELWTSLISLVLSYVAAHELGLVPGRVTTSVTDERLVIATPARVLTIECHAGAGTWTLSENRAGSVVATGSFRIGTDSMVAFSDRKGKLELDVAAEAFTARILDEE